MIDLLRAEEIEKGVHHEGLLWLAEQASACQKIVELGSYHGRSARAMLDNSDAHLWCIDTWDWQRNGSQWKVTEEDYKIFLGNLADIQDRVTILEMTTSEAIEYLTPSTFDMIFIDASHDYESVRFDIIHYMPLLITGGLLCGHDYHNGRAGVDRAVGELIEHCHEELDAIWWTRV